MEYEVITIRPGQDLSPVLRIRREIFGTGEDDLDEIGISVVLKSEGGGGESEDIACGRIVLDLEADRLIIEQIGVAEPFRRKGFGGKVLDLLMDIAKECEADEVRAKSRGCAEAEGLLSKHGFEEAGYYWMTIDTENYRRS